MGHTPHLSCDKTFYHHLATIQSFGFVLLFFDASGFADLINGPLLITHKLAVLFYLHTQSRNGVLVLLTVYEHEVTHPPDISLLHLRLRNLCLANTMNPLTPSERFDLF